MSGHYTPTQNCYLKTPTLERPTLASFRDTTPVGFFDMFSGPHPSTRDSQVTQWMFAPSLPHGELLDLSHSVLYAQCKSDFVSQIVSGAQQGDRLGLALTRAREVVNIYLWRRNKGSRLEDDLDAMTINLLQTGVAAGQYDKLSLAFSQDGRCHEFEVGGIGSDSGAARCSIMSKTIGENSDAQTNIEDGVKEKMRDVLVRAFTGQSE